MSRFIIIGAGECGVRAAFALRDLGFEGEILLLDAEDALPYERPPLSKATGEPLKIVRPENAYLASDIKLMRGVEVEALFREARQIQIADGTCLSYDKLLLATGARARLFPNLHGCLTLRTASDAQRIGSALGTNARIGVVGAGFIGLELAATARRAGSEVTVIETVPRVLARAVPEAIAAIVHARHEQEGVTIRTGTAVKSANLTRIELEDGEVLPFDTVIAGVGALPNADLAKRAGLVVNNGVVVDSEFRTSDPLVYAAGDCCSFEWRGASVRLESWKAARDQGSHVAACMMGKTREYNNVPRFWSDQFDMTLQVVGLFDMTSTIYQRLSSPDKRIVFQLTLDGAISAVAGIGRENEIASDVAVLERLIERQASPSIEALLDPEIKLKALLRTS